MEKPMTAGFEEKKWFVYLTDHHEGPFAVAEIQAKIREGQLGAGHYVWADGMPDWRLIREVGAFSLPNLGTETGAPALASSAAPEASKSARGAETRPGRAAEPASSHFAPTMMASQVGPFPSSGEPLPLDQDGNGPLLAGVGAALVVIIGLVAVLIVLLNSRDSRYPGLHVAVQPAAHWLIGRFPALGNVLSPVPMLEDVKPEELRELRSAASAPIGRQGPALSVALSSADPANPVFYVASNLPDGARIDIHLDGIGDTLLNQLTSQASLTVTLAGNFAKSAVARLPDGKPLPRGEYHVFAVDSPTQPPEIARLLASRQPMTVSEAAGLPQGVRLMERKSYFLGGPKDQIYASRLKDFHDKVHEKAASELTELKQFSSTLEGQLNTLLAKAEEIRKMKTSQSALKKKAWTSFDAQWSGLQGQLNQSFQKWTPDKLRTEVFYSELYDQLTRTGHQIEEVHELEGGVVGHSNPEQTEITQLTQATTAAQAAIAQLNAGIDQAEKAPPTPGGLPRKEGL